MKQKIAPRWKFLQYSFWLGPVLIIMGLSAGFVSGTWEPVPLGLMIAGVVIVGLWFLFRVYFRQGDSVKHPYWSRRSTQAGTNALLATVSVFVIIGLINYLAVRHAVRLDLTENQQFTLAPQTQTQLANLDEPVKVTIFDRLRNPQTRELLDQYRRIAPEKFSYEYIDPQLQPGVAQDYGVTDFGEVYVESGEQRQSIPKDNVAALSEAQLTNGIEQLLSNRTAKIYFLQGHGERSLTDGQGGLQNAVNALDEKNFISEPLTLTQQATIPEDADVIVVAGPKRALFKGEVAALEEYLEQGGSLLLMIDPKTDPGLTQFLEKWGVQIDDRLAIDATGSGRLVGLGPTVPIVREYGDHPITQPFRNESGISFYPVARPVETRTIDGITETPLLWTEAESWAETNLASRELEFDPDRDRKGPLSLGVALTKPVEVTTAEVTETEDNSEETTEENTETEETISETETEDNSEESTETEETTTENSEVAEESSEEVTTEETTADSSQVVEDNSETAPTEETPEQTKPPEARLVVLGNSQFATNGWFEQQLNGDVFINTVSWLSRTDEATLSIRPKPATNRRIAMTPVLGRSLSWSALVIIPLFGFVSAAILWWRRR